ncbi:unnamed protein product [Ilex paraguariensis]|uniref:SBP-type domain-containing protein n=1 Tax=Ilex paraguariensis TaxID=185542 RepID=A0ABC8URQ3_9AQUA
MDRMLKSPDWNLTEFGQVDNGCLAACVGSNSLGRQKDGGGFFVDFELGRLRKLRDGGVDKLQEGRRSTTVSPSSSLKRTRAIGGTQNVLCLVDGCTTDLKSCREYHQRHRVCERHSKTPVVTVGGKEQRFCQQCSRFHSLGEFDEVKRSCRKRLDGHNRRRRKPQPESFSGPQAYATNRAGGSGAWPSVDKHGQKLHAIIQQSTSSNSFARISSKIERQFPFLLVNDPEKSNQAASPAKKMTSQRLPDTNASPASGRGPLKMLSNTLTQLEESKRALSLLSTNSAQTLGTIWSNLVQQDVIHLNQSELTSSCFSDFSEHSNSKGMAAESIDPFSIPDALNTNDPNGILCIGSDVLLEIQPQMLSFSCK